MSIYLNEIVKALETAENTKKQLSPKNPNVASENPK